MAKFWACVLALVLNLNQVYIFRKAEDYDSFQQVTYILLVFAAFALLWDSCIYPSSYRKLYPVCQFIIELSIVTFLMEFILIDFFMPLAKAFSESLGKLADCIESLMSTIGVTLDPVNELCNILRSDDAKSAADIGLGVFFLVVILHATRIIDLRIITCGGAGAFANDISERSQAFAKQLFGPSCPKRNRCRHYQNCATTGYQESPRLIQNNDENNDVVVDRRYKNRRNK